MKINCLRQLEIFQNETATVTIDEPDSDRQTDTAYFVAVLLNMDNYLHKRVFVLSISPCKKFMQILSKINKFEMDIHKFLLKIVTIYAKNIVPNCFSFKIHRIILTCLN